MLKLIALNYTVMLNGYSQWLNIRKKKNPRASVVLVSVILVLSHKKDAIKQILKIYGLYDVSTLIWKLNEKLLQCNIKVYLKTLNGRWD